MSSAGMFSGVKPVRHDPAVVQIPPIIFQPIVPPPEEPAEALFWNGHDGKATAVYPYYNWGGKLEGYVRRWDCVTEAGKRDKKILPLRFGRDGERTGWLAKGWDDNRP